MKKKNNRSMVYLPLALCMGYANTGFAIELPQEPNPPACHDHTYKTRDCGEWSYLTELQNPDAWKFARINGEKRARLYGVQEAQAMVAPAKPRVIALEGVHFDFDKALLRSDALPILETNARDLKSAPYMKITVVGHTDSKGSEDYRAPLKTL